MSAMRQQRTTLNQLGDRYPYSVRLGHPGGRRRPEDTRFGFNRLYMLPDKPNFFASPTATAGGPCYVGWWSAAFKHGFTTQVPMVVFVATTDEACPPSSETGDAEYVEIPRHK